MAPEGETHYSYDKNGNILSVKSDDFLTERKFDALNRVVSVTQCLTNPSLLSEYGFDENTVDISNIKNTIQYKYDEYSNLVQIIYPDNSAVTYTYDVIGNLSTVTDWNGNVTKYEYDKLNREVKTVHPDKSVTTKEYDEVGNITKIQNVNQNGITEENVSYSYDEGNRLTNETNLKTGVAYTYKYDDLNRVIKRTCSIYRGPQPTYETFTYDDACNVVTAYENGKNNTMTYSNSDNTLTSVNGLVPEFDNDGNMLQIELNKGIIELTYDSKNLLKQAGNDSYVYDPEGYRVASVFVKEKQEAADKLNKTKTLSEEVETLEAGEVETVETVESIETVEYDEIETVEDVDTIEEIEGEAIHSEATIEDNDEIFTEEFSDEAVLCLSFNEEDIQDVVLETDAKENNELTDEVKNPDDTVDVVDNETVNQDTEAELLDNSKAEELELLPNLLENEAATLALSNEKEEMMISLYCYDRQNKNLLVQYNLDGSIVKFVYGNSLISSETTSVDEDTINKVYHYDLRGSAVRITDLDGTLLGSSKWVSPT